MSIFFNTLKTIEIEKGEKDYPIELLDLIDPPEVIRIRGMWPQDFSNALSVVGSRNMSIYGKRVISEIIPKLCHHNVTIVSGFMYGVDTEAHRAALKVKGKTVAVLGNGLNHIYPRQNEGLYTEIIQSGGCIISEYPMTFKPQKWSFPQRNRIVAALSMLGTLVVEASERSGSLITASYADALNRPLYAVPGPIFSPTSDGTNQIIKTKIARLVTCANDIVSEIP